MLFTRRPKHLAVFNSNSITVYPTPDSAPLTKEFTPETLSHQEVLNPEGYQSSLSPFFAEQNLSDGTVVVLDDDVVYSHIFSPALTPDDSRLEDYLSTIPFDREKLVYRIINNRGMSTVYVINREIVSNMCQALMPAGGECAATVPLAAYGLSGHRTLLKQEIDKILSNRYVPTASEMLFPEKFKASAFAVAAPFLAVIFVILAGLFAGSVGYQIYRRETAPPATPIPAVQATPEAAPSPESTASAELAPATPSAQLATPSSTRKR